MASGRTTSSTEISGGSGSGERLVGAIDTNEVGQL